MGCVLLGKVYQLHLIRNTNLIFNYTDQLLNNQGNYPVNNSK